MALTLSSHGFSRRYLDLGDAIDEIKARVRAGQPQSLQDAAPFLFALGRNRSFLIDVLAKKLTAGDESAAGGPQDTSLLLYWDSVFVLRANFWFPAESFPASYVSLAPSLAYLVPHNHDYDLLTIGYWGPGYRTTIYECKLDRETVLAPSDAVDLRFMETTVLHPGKLMLYRAFKDVHLQEHPPDFSISLNVALLPLPGSAGQHLFDIATRSVRGVLDPAESQSRVCELAAALGDPCLAQNLMLVERNTANCRIRSAARAARLSLLKQEP